MSTKMSSTIQDTLPWIEKHRPESLDDLIAHEQIISTIGRLIDAGKLPHMLFYGPPGTGKTSTILACARKLYGKSYKAMVLELNASDDRGIAVVRNQITSFAGTRKLFSSGVKLIILDEADALTKDAQAALRRVIEKYARTTRFCLICNYVSKIIPAIQSRCTRFRFAPLLRSQMEQRTREIATEEGVTLTDDGLDAIMRLSCGDMRRMLNTMQSAHLAFETVDEKSVHLCLGQPLPKDIQTIFDALMNASFQNAYETIWTLMSTQGLALVDVLARLVDRYVLRGVKLPPPVRSFLLQKLADIEHALSGATTDKIQLGAIVAAFVIARKMMQNLKK